jgi:cellulose synthase/poly-beta-1,6-N-acetylglucosamine synthase-like glycosyltransferase
LLTAARNEAAYLGHTIQAVAKQSILPACWVIVDDGSFDCTSGVIEAFSRKLDFLRYVRRTKDDVRRDFRAKSEALHLGWQQLRELSFDYVGVLDADTEVPPDYYERVIELMKRDWHLGIAGGWVWEKSHGEWRPRRGNRERSVPGACQVFRRACFEAIGGMPALRYGGEDTLESACRPGHRGATSPADGFLQCRTVALSHIDG